MSCLIKISYLHTHKYSHTRKSGFGPNPNLIIWTQPKPEIELDTQKKCVLSMGIIPILISNT